MVCFATLAVNGVSIGAPYNESTDVHLAMNLGVRRPGDSHVVVVISGYCSVDIDGAIADAQLSLDSVDIGLANYAEGKTR